jgi:hypothetical protein
VLKQEPVGKLQEQIEATKIQTSKTKHVKLSIKGMLQKCRKRCNTKYKKREIQTWRIIPGHFKRDRRKSLNRRNRQRKIIRIVGMAIHVDIQK